jgi:hypothetical protein
VSRLFVEPGGAGVTVPGTQSVPRQRIGRQDGQLDILDLVGRVGPTLPGLDLHSQVPAMIGEMAGWDDSTRFAAARKAVDVIASGADVLWADPRDAKRAETGPDEVRYAITTGLAVLAYRSGGVNFGGLHWHADACVDCPGPGRWQLPDSLHRDVRGAFFTPPGLAMDIVSSALPVVNQPHWSRQVEHLEDLAIADISCGSGAFLVAAARWLAEQFVNAWYDRDPYDPAVYRDALDEAVCLVYGVDIDAVSVELTRLALQLLVPWQERNGRFGRTIRVGDALIGRTHLRLEQADTYPPTAHRFDWDTEFRGVFTGADFDRRGFDAIIGNPPYLGGQKLTGAFGKKYRDHLVEHLAGGRRGSADLAVYFWLRAHQLVNDVGVVAIIATNTLLQGASRRVGYDQLTAQGWRIYRAYEERWPTAAAAVMCAIVWTVLRSYVPHHLELDEVTL